jgi:hypothetical protein
MGAVRVHVGAKVWSGIACQISDNLDRLGTLCCVVVGVVLGAITVVVSDKTLGVNNKTVHEKAREAIPHQDIFSFWRDETPVNIHRNA